MIDHDQPVLAFVITDAGPHYSWDKGATAVHERKILKELGYIADINEPADVY